jgi:NADPH-dependent 2,4-dienoyl-CoA reductase/sulfur reductase-like enzyme
MPWGYVLGEGNDSEEAVMRTKVLVLGANFGGLTAALAVHHELDGDVEVTVVSPSDRFPFNPSLIWLPFGTRDREDITFPVVPTLESHGIDFVHAAATGIDPVARAVTTDAGQVLYDYLVIATGYRNQDDVVPAPARTPSRSPRWRTRSGRGRARDGSWTIPAMSWSPPPRGRMLRRRL